VNGRVRRDLLTHRRHGLRIVASSLRIIFLCFLRPGLGTWRFLGQHEADAHLRAGDGPTRALDLFPKPSLLVHTCRQIPRYKYRRQEMTRGHVPALVLLEARQPLTIAHGRSFS
jgi:hypothetical protein